jgi:hypothetical protein
MKKIYLLLFCLAIQQLLVIGKPVEIAATKQVAINYLNSLNGKQNQIQADNLKEVHRFTSTDGRASFVVWSSGQNFTIVSCDDVLVPVVAYSFESKFELHYNVEQWFSKLNEQFELATKLDEANLIEPNAQNKLLWENLISGKIDKQNQIASPNAVAPLVKTKWDQGEFYNAKCPGPANNRAVTGCVATAMAQVMKFWNHPKTGAGQKSYRHPVYGTLSANFGATTYDWASMPNQVTSRNDAVATLMYHCGVAVEMDYSPESSGAAGAEIAAPSMVTNFSYPNAKMVERDGKTKNQWIAILKEQIDKGRPMYYQGIGKGGGHAFVCDGYDDNSLFHFNWGWSGVADGYYSVDALAPTSLGFGGGMGEYDDNQSIIADVFVEQSVPTGDAELVLQSSLVLQPSEILFNGEISVTADFKNPTNKEYNDSLAAVLFDDAGNYVTMIEALKSTIEVNKTLAIEFTNVGISRAAPGNYFVAVFQKIKGEYQIVKGEGVDFVVPLTILSPDVAIRLWDSIQVYQKGVYVGNTGIDVKDSVEIRFDAGNFGDVTFDGEITFDLFTIEGEYIKELSKIGNLKLDAGFHFDGGLKVKTSFDKIEKGTYLLTAWYKATSDVDYTLVGANFFKNPIEINVLAEPLLQDTYEPNDSMKIASKIELKTIGKSYVFSNFHTNRDVDYFKITNSTGKQLELSMLLTDRDNSASFSGDASFYYDYIGVESDVFDLDTAKLIISVGGAIDLKSFPTFAGLNGSYALELNAVESQLSIQDELANSTLIIPNLVRDKFNVRSALDFKSYEIINQVGEVIESKAFSTEIEVTNLSAGTYFLKLYSEKDGFTIVKQFKVVR